MSRFDQRRLTVMCVAAAVCALVIAPATCFSADVGVTLGFKTDVAATAGERLRVKAFSLTAASGFVMLVASAEDQTKNPRILRLEKTLKLAKPLYLRSPHVVGLAVEDGGGVVVFEKLNEDPKDKRGAFRTFNEAGAMVSEAALEGGIAGFVSLGSTIAYLTPEGLVKSVGNITAAPNLSLVSDREEFPKNIILPSSISFFRMSNGSVGAVGKASGKLYSATLAKGEVKSSVLHSPEIDEARATYAAIVTASKGAIRPGSSYATPTPALATVADESGAIYSLISPYSQKAGATIIQTDSSGRYVQSIRVPLNVFEGSYFGPTFVAVRSNMIYLAAPDGRIAGFIFK